MDDKNKKTGESIAKPSGAIQINSTPISLIQRKAWNLLLYNAFRDLSTKKRHTVSVNDLSKALGYKDTEQLKESIKKMVSTPIEFNILQSKDRSVWQVMSLLSVATIEDNIMTYGYVEELLEKLVNKPIYTRINIEIMKAISSKYALSLYELACDHLMQARGEGITPEIPLQELQKILGCDDNELYKDFRYFNRDILKKAMKEVNEKTDVSIEAKLKRVNKKVRSIQFQIEAKEDRSAMLRAIAGPKQGELPIVPGSTLYERLVKEYELTESQAKQVLSSCDDKHITERLIWVTLNYKNNQDKTKSLGAVTYWAITTNDIKGLPEPEEEKPPLPEVKPGMKIDIGCGQTVAVDEYGYVYNDLHQIIPVMDIRLGLSEGKYRIIEDEVTGVPSSRQ